MSNISAQQSLPSSSLSMAAAKVRSAGRLAAAVVLPAKAAGRVRKIVFNIRNKGYKSIGGHLFPSRGRQRG